MTHLSLFSGIGGLDLAAEAAGFETVGQCEFAEYPYQVLCKHWPDVLKWRDIRTLTGESFYEQTGESTVDIISGGFPCQPFSVAGKQKGERDDRYLWPEMLRVIREISPRWVVGENVPGILRLAAKTVVQDLEREGFNVVVFDFEAAAIGARHRRERIAFVANRDSGRRGENGERESVDGIRNDKTDNIIPLAERDSCIGESRNGRSADKSRLGRVVYGLPDWLDEPRIARTKIGVKFQKERVQCLGNSVVPQQFYPIFRAIADIENEL